jgi:hypothetical protein
MQASVFRRGYLTSLQFSFLSSYLRLLRRRAAPAIVKMSLAAQRQQDARLSGPYVSLYECIACCSRHLKAHERITDPHGAVLPP